MSVATHHIQDMQEHRRQLTQYGAIPWSQPGAGPASDNSWHVDPYKIREDTYHEGNSVLLEMAQRFKIRYKCHFNVRKYPFDQHKCKISLRMMAGQEKINIKQEKPGLSGRQLLIGKREIREFSVITVEAKNTKYGRLGLSNLSSNLKNQSTNSTQETFEIIIQNFVKFQ